MQIRLGEHGLSSLIYEGHEFLLSARSGEILPVNYTPRLSRGNDSIQGSSNPISVFVDNKKSTVKYTYPWSTIIVNYTIRDDNLLISIKIKNTDNYYSISNLTLGVAQLTFLEVPTGRVLEAGMWGTGGILQPLHIRPQMVAPDQAPPIVEIRTSNIAAVFASDDIPTEKRLQSIGIPFTTDRMDKRSYPLWITIKPLPPGADLTVNVSLRFGSAASDLQSLAGDVLQTYRRSYPYELTWPSHAPIGALFLATSQPHPLKNPRGWFLNAKDVDVTTPAGLQNWHDRLMAFADRSIRVLQDMGAQGMITWDPEGQEFPNATFYGAPQLTSKLAPETNFASAGTLETIDEYFAKFRAVGLRTGVTLRPQRIVFHQGIPVQEFSEDPFSELLEKIRYARKRWGCTLFYIDSTYDMSGPLSADIMRSLRQANPDVLLIPENEDFRDFAYTAPLNSFNHFGVTQTPSSVREVYKDAFSVIFASLPQRTSTASIERLVDAVRNGDILLVGGWYPGPHVEYAKQIYKEAREKKSSH
ncbi:hypothetical protein [Labrys monachus]|uniref:Uncharacterized protein n=1 Tax=Labrys monachus TaxID=217067 RepID=A0ABU0FL02_9HYPH|nr:hypothetical protein [Labrys monachus]MDQ0394773.1 hypothetical protein [Labrys monachus]